jgi:L-rhamnose mutarotase
MRLFGLLSTLYNKLEINMIRSAFKMKLSSGNIEEYERRHDEIWPELVEVLREAGVRDYSIFYDEETKTLFASQKLTEENTVESLAMNEVVRKWWDYMNDGIMEYNEKDEPVVVPLKEVFHMD